jgi:tRNA (guanine-N7-)-methyltransferase
LPQPTDWDALFGRKAPLIVEIGFGNASHLLHLAHTHPEANVLGVEVSHPSVKRAGKKISGSGLQNVRAAYGSAEGLLWLTLLPASISQLHINFPDPWPKGGHHRRRLINDTFLHLAATRMLPGAKLFVATDHPDYQPVVTDCLTRTPYFTSRLPTIYTTHQPDRFITKYEAKAAAEGRTSFYYSFERNAVEAPNPFTPSEELPMPHVVVALPLTLAEIGARFVPQQFVSPDQSQIVRFIEAYASTRGTHLMVEAYINQEPLDQRLGFRLQARDEESVIVKLHDIGFPRVTSGAQFGVACMAAWLLSLSNSAEITLHNLPLPLLRAVLAQGAAVLDDG